MFKERNWLHIFSPCIIVIIFLLVGIFVSLLDMKDSGGWSLLGVILLAPLIAVIVVIDIVTKKIAKKRIIQLWIIEICLLTVCIFGFIQRWVR